MAPGSQEATFLSEDEHEEGESSMARVFDKVPLAGQTKSVMIRFWKRAKSIGFILNQTTRSLEDRASLLKSRRRRQGHMSFSLKRE
jgi:hypothetical protein